MMVDPDVTSVDYGDSFFQRTRQALYENVRESTTITVPEATPFIIGVLITLFERAFGFCANLININACHQPCVAAGKRSASDMIEIQRSILKHLRKRSAKSANIGDISSSINVIYDVKTVFSFCQRLASNPDHGVKRVGAEWILNVAYRRG